jgi:F-type H+-transporting ATPase subunit epsilon
MYQLQVLTPEEIIFDDQVVSLIAPGALGYLGILTNHAPLITTLKTGTLIITDKNKQKHFFEVSGGFLEVNRNKASLLVDTIKPASAIEMGGGI